ncbi:MAG: T9SS type A sorting domain-containing protein [Flavobacteriales bacterium]|nr:T9SS type A sorting domain-containing protein [Flavobacteriales bacterium]
MSELHRYRLNGPDCTGHPDDLLVTSDGSVLIWGKSSFYALKASASGEVIWAKRFNGSGGFDFIKELPSGDLLAGVSMDGAGATVLRMSPMGEVLWCRSYFRPTGVMCDAIIRSDGSFAVVGFTTGRPHEYPPPPGYDPSLFVMELDGAGDIQGCRGFDAEAVWDVQYSARATPTSDGREVFMVSSSTGSMLMKLQLDGDTLWTRWQGADGFVYEVMGLLAMSDGGFLINGRATGSFSWSPLITRSYFFKTDTMGRLPCFDRQLPVYVTDLAPMDSAFTISANDGADMENVQFENLNVPVFESYEGCVYNSIPPIEEVSFHIRPNPNTGHFTVQFADPLRAESYYSVYDTMGKLLVQRRLPTGATVEEVDLSRFGAGTYAIKFTSPSGVCLERVVVE